MKLRGWFRIPKYGLEYVPSCRRRVNVCKAKSLIALSEYRGLKHV